MEKEDASVEEISPGLEAASEVQERLGGDLTACFQCLKCTSGCPMADHMDLMPAEIIRLLQLGQIHRVLESDSIWLCAGCLTCSTRCPNEIDIAHIMDKLRQEAVARGIKPGNEKIASFHKAFLKSVKRHGRSFESGLLAAYAIKNGELMKNMGLGMTMFFKGKMPIIPKNVSGRKAIRKMFENYQRKLAEKKGS